MVNFNRKEYAKAYYLKNREKLLEQSNTYSKTHPEVRNSYYTSHKEMWRKRALENRSKLNKIQKEYYERHKTEILKKAKVYRELHKESIASYSKNRYLKDINFRIANVLRSRLIRAIKNGAKSGSAVRDLGCSIDELRFYLEGKFTDGMTWENWTIDGWHIDHIIPLAYFDLKNREQFLKAVHYTNLQPLWAIDNLKRVTTQPMKKIDQKNKDLRKAIKKLAEKKRIRSEYPF